MTTHHVFKLDMTADQFEATIEKGQSWLSGKATAEVAVPVSLKKLCAHTYKSGDTVEILTTRDKAAWIGEIYDTSDYDNDSEHGFVQHPTEVYVELT